VQLILLVLGVALASWIAWISIQSLLQARTLFRLARTPSMKPDEYGRQAAYGRVRVERALSKGFGEVLWCRTEHQEYRRRGKSSSWKTVSTQEEIASFTFEASEGELRLADPPSEVQGTRGHTDTHERGGFFGWSHAHGDRRTVYTYLPVTPYVSVAGRRVDGGRFGRDNKLGLFLSPHEPGKAATIELWKGLFGLAVVTAAVVVGLVMYAERR
jgi:hypothetical protein